MRKKKVREKVASFIARHCMYLCLFSVCIIDTIG